MSNEVDIAYRELGLTNHETLINTLNGLNLTTSFATDSISFSPVTNVINDVAVPSVSNTINVPDQTQAIDSLTTATTAHTTQLTGIKDNLTSVSQNATKQNEIADYMTSSKKLSDYEIGFNTEITLADGSVEMSSHTPLEIHMMNSLKSHEISDYKTTPQNVYNFDGNLVTSYIKPIELEVVKNSVEAKNNSDEMEYKVPDDVLEEMYSKITLPSYTRGDIFQDNIDILNSMGLGSE